MSNVFRLKQALLNKKAFVMTDLARYKERQSLIRAELYKVQTS
jgi:hypothetical protein